MSQLFAWGGQSIGVSTSASVFPMIYIVLINFHKSRNQYWGLRSRTLPVPLKLPSMILITTTCHPYIGPKWPLFWPLTALNFLKLCLYITYTWNHTLYILSHLPSFLQPCLMNFSISLSIVTELPFSLLHSIPLWACHSVLITHIYISNWH